MRTVFALLVFVAALFGGVDPSFAQAPVLTEAQKRDVLVSIEGVGRRGFLYRVTADDGRDLFLYGTVHLGKVGSEPFNGPVLAALRASQRLAVEADPSDADDARRLTLRLGMYDEHDGLQRHVTPALLARVQAFGQKQGLSSERVLRFRPWLLANMIALSGIAGLGLDPALGSELYLTGFARGMGMPIAEIEGLEAQLRMLADLPASIQTAQLEEALAEADRPEAQAEIRALFAAWLEGDAAAGEAFVAAMREDSRTKVFERHFVEVLLDRRNRSMADAAERLLRQPGATFFAVGALHLFGGSGLIEEFRRRGYRVVDLQPA